LDTPRCTGLRNSDGGVDSVVVLAVVVAVVAMVVAVVAVVAVVVALVDPCRHHSRKGRWVGIPFFWNTSSRS
jgi:hypothetical protein